VCTQHVLFNAQHNHPTDYRELQGTTEITRLATEATADYRISPLTTENLLFPDVLYDVETGLQSDIPAEDNTRFKSPTISVGLQPVPIFDGLTGGTDGTEPVRWGRRGDIETGRVRDGLTR
jgi:hypothetical protein